MKRKILSMLLALILCVGLAIPAVAASDEAIAAADKLNELGLFNGVGNNEDGTPNYDLDRAPNRAEAVTLLVRLLGKEAEATAGNWNIPFSDVANWAKPYVGYAYANGLTTGTSATTFSGNDTVSATQYLTFVLRALGYSSDGDFAWNAAWELTDELGITDGTYTATSSFTRGDAVIVSANGLAVKLKDGSKTLLEAIEESLANAPKAPETSDVPGNTPDVPQTTPSAATFTYSGSAWAGHNYPLPTGHDNDTITAKVEVLSKHEAVFTIESDNIGEYMWYGAEFTKSWTERQWVNNGAAEVDVTKSNEVYFEFFMTAGGADAEFGVYTVGIGEENPQFTFSDAVKGDGQMTIRITLSPDCGFDFEMLKDLKFIAHLCTNYG